MHELGGKYYFRVLLTPVTAGLFVSDGTAAGTRLSLGLPMNHFFFDTPWIAGVFNGELWVVLRNTTLWTVSGSPAVLKSVATVGGAPSSFVALGSDVLFQTQSTGGLALWRSDGTEAGTSEISRIGGISAMERVGSRVWFANSRGAGRELWASDGTAAGTVEVADLRPGGGGSDPADFIELPGGGVGFSAADGVHGREFWRTDGTRGGTVMLTDLAAPSSTADSKIQILAEINGIVFFGLDDAIHGEELWCSDGSASGTKMVTDLYPGAGSSRPTQPRVLGGRLYFLARVPPAQSTAVQVFVTNGTASGTLQLTNHAQGVEPSSLHVHGHQVFYTPVDAASESVRAYNTVTGQDQVLMSVATHYGRQKSYVSIGSTVYFVAVQSSNFSQLWKTDGTPGGTSPFGPTDEVISQLTLWKNRFVFATEGVSSHGLWISDGTTIGTSYLGFVPAPRDLVATDSQVFCTGSFGGPLSLYRTDGTTSGTGLVTDEPAVKEKIVALGDDVLFIAEDRVVGDEVFRSDGTRAGTRQVSEIEAGYRGTAASLTPAGSRHVYFLGSNSRSGDELWVTNGTRAGTWQVEDLAAGTANGYGGQGVLLAGGKLFFVADNGRTGFELYAMELGATAKTFGSACGRSGSALEATDPVLGGSMVIRGRNAPSAARNVLLVGLGPAFRLLDCDLYISQPLVHHGVPSGSSWSQSIAIPNDPSAVGVRLIMQMFHHVASAPRGFELSNALDLTLGY